MKSRRLQRILRACRFGADVIGQYLRQYSLNLSYAIHSLERKVCPHGEWHRATSVAAYCIHCDEHMRVTSDCPEEEGDEEAMNPKFVSGEKYP